MAETRLARAADEAGRAVPIRILHRDAILALP